MKPITNLAIFDLDHTITRKDTYLGFLAQILKDHPWRVMRTIKLPFAVLIYKAGLKNNSWLKEVFLKAVAGGMTQNQIRACSDKFIGSLRQNGYYRDALNCIQAHQKQNHTLILATASFDLYIQDIADQLGFQKVICTQALWDQQKLTGRIAGKNCYGQEKADRVEKLFKQLPTKAPYKIYAYSDHASDLPLFMLADKATAINPKPKMQELAKRHSIEVVKWQ